MSDPVEKALAPSVLKPASNPGAGRRQQWRLVFEKAYLALSGSDMAQTQDARGGLAGTQASLHVNRPVTQTLPPAQPGVGTADNMAPAVYEYGADTVDLEAVPDNGGFEQRIVELLNGLRLPAGLNRQESAAKLAPSEREALQAREFKNALRDKSLLLLPSGEGLDLVIRDAAMGTDLLNRIVRKVQDILNSRGIRLARVVVNGAELWREKAEEAATDGSDLINRIY